MRHLETSLGYRFECQGGVLAYTGDTEWCEEAVQLARDADLLIIECSTRDDQPLPGHLTPSGVASIIRSSRARRVVLVHIYPDPGEEDLASAVRRACEAEVALGRDGQIITLRNPGA
jgi:ribonuclease BN (tRNA processing enzyme)